MSFKKWKGEALKIVDGKSTLRDVQWLGIKKRALRAFLALYPYDGTMLHKLGTLQCKLRNYDESVRYLERALQFGSDNPSLAAELELARSGIYVEGPQQAFQVVNNLEPAPSNWRKLAQKNAKGK